MTLVCLDVEFETIQFLSEFKISYIKVTCLDIKSKDF